MEALLSLYEVFTLYSLFMLCVEMLAPAADWKSQLILMQSRSIFPFKSFRRKYFRVVQVIPVTFICTLATIISTARECWMNQESRRLIGIVSIIGVSKWSPFLGIRKTHPSPGNQHPHGHIRYSALRHTTYVDAQEG